MNTQVKRTPLVRPALFVAVALVLAACQTTGESGVAEGKDESAARAEARAVAAQAVAAAEATAREAGPTAAGRTRQQAARKSLAPPPAAAMPDSSTLDRIEVTGSRVDYAAAPASVQAPMPMPMAVLASPPPANTERYAAITDNPVHRAAEQPVSTFSVDVDTGSYANVRRMLNEGVRPPADAVRAEEFINYFDYGHRAPGTREVPFRVTTELAVAPWNPQRQLLMVGIKGYDVPKATLAPANLVFLIDTSGSMDSPDKLPLVKQSLRQLIPQLRSQDRVSIVVYAGSAGLVLAPTPGDHHGEILAALDRLEAGGSTNGGDGIRLAYAMARQAHVDNGVNRVILATDGDFNVGTVDQEALETLVGDQRKHGIALTTLGFGSGNYNDAMAEQLADVGDGNHAYIDSLREARKVLVDQMSSTLMTIARDVKVQIEFNPAQVAEYRLIGYENRILQREDFSNDKVDAGDIGAGHEVTALYEITPVSSPAQRVASLRYGSAAPKTTQENARNEVAHLRLRYKLPDQKLPDQGQSRLIETPILTSQLVREPDEALRFASAVAGFADALRGGSRMDGWSLDDMIRTATAAKGRDPNGERTELLELMKLAQAQIGSENQTRIGMGQ
ncbi:von Willebrand factor type A domain-containing protein [Lysobacter sp. TAF61]|uniref:vWA domain-containing protein n=1 Tax=Lysobacter sp. TAF61 TaxID=3233072 RepID=UPI003F986D0E